MPESIDDRAYQALFTYSNIGIIIADAAGIIQQANPFAKKIFGYQDHGLVGEKIEILIPTTLRHRHEEHRAEYNEKPRPRDMGMGVNLMALKKDGTEFPVEVSLTFYQVEGKRQIVSFITDITFRKKAEEELKRLNTELEAKVAERTQELSQALLELSHINENLQEEMEQRKNIESEVRRALEKEKELSELKSRFVSMASHEFRTPLSGILTSVSLIARYHQAQDEGKRTKHVKTIKTSVQNLTNILDDFLSLDKLDQGKITCRPSSFHLVGLAQTLVVDMQELAKEGQNITYRHHGAETAIFLDKEMLRNVLINLLSNAMKYSPPQTAITFVTKQEDSQIVLSIQDQGMGIPESDQKNIFETFFRANNATTIQGTGLGLNIVKRYLDLMGGRVTFVSQENVGTIFTVTVPLEKL
jgi:PAS domain S-box-containing protein